LQIKSGEFVCFIGDVGSGKSSFLSSLIGDMLYLHPDLLEEFGGKNITEQTINAIKLK